MTYVCLCLFSWIEQLQVLILSNCLVCKKLIFGVLFIGEYSLACFMANVFELSEKMVIV